MSTDTAAEPKTPSRFNVGTILREPLLGPMAALLIAVIVFSSISSSFLNPQNVSLILQQSVVVGILAVGQTLIILTSGIDLSIGAVAVMGSIVMAQSAGANGPVVALGSTLAVCVAFGAINGGLVTVLRLPPFIVTLGTFTAIQAATRLLAGSETYQVPSGPLTLLGNSFKIGSFSTTYGVVVMLLVYAVMWYALSQTSWGRHIYAVGGSRRPRIAPASSPVACCSRCTSLRESSRRSRRGQRSDGSPTPIRTRIRMPTSSRSPRWSSVEPVCSVDAAPSSAPWSEH